MKSNRFWIGIIIAVLFLGVLITAIFYMLPQDGKIANVYLNGKCIRSIDLSAVKEPYTFEVKSLGGKNTVSVKKGEIGIVEANCPDQICVKQGCIHNGYKPIVCLPHRLVIEIEKESAGPTIDTVSQ